jgi:hypothetical protein
LVDRVVVVVACAAASLTADMRSRTAEPLVGTP